MTKSEEHLEGNTIQIGTHLVGDLFVPSLFLPVEKAKNYGKIVRCECRIEELKAYLSEYQSKEVEDTILKLESEIDKLMKL